MFICLPVFSIFSEELSEISRYTVRFAGLLESTLPFNEDGLSKSFLST